MEITFAYTTPLRWAATAGHFALGLSLTLDVSVLHPDLTCSDILTAGLSENTIHIRLAGVDAPEVRRGLVS